MGVTWDDETPTKSSGVTWDDEATPDNSPSFLKKAGSYVGNAVLGAGETALSLGTGALAYPISKLGGAGMSVYQGLAGNTANAGAEAKQFEKYLQDIYTYKPITQSGQQAAGFIGKLMSAPTYPTRKAGEYAAEKGYPNLGYGIETAGEYGTLAAMPYVKPAVTAVGRGIVDVVADTSIPQRLAASSIKMPLSRKWTKMRGEEGTSLTKQAVDKMLEEKIHPSEYGLEQTKAGRASTGKAIGEEVSRTEGTVDIDSLMSEGLKKARENAKNGENPIKELEAIDKWEEAFRASRSDKLTPTEAQRLKIELYRRINFDKTSGAGDSIVETIRKGVAHDAMTKLEELNPKLAELNKSDAGYILLQEALERSLARRSNRDIIGLGTKVLLGRESWPLAAFNATVGHPQVKATMAIVLNKAKTAAQRSIANRPTAPTESFSLDRTYSESLPPVEEGPYGPIVSYPSTANYSPWQTSQRALDTAAQKRAYLESRGSGPSARMPQGSRVKWAESPSTPVKNIEPNSQVWVTNSPHPTMNDVELAQLQRLMRSPKIEEAQFGLTGQTLEEYNLFQDAVRRMIDAGKGGQ
jgi:hypothetical protein